jgi:hypothetical protein
LGEKRFLNRNQNNQFDNKENGGPTKNKEDKEKDQKKGEPLVCYSEICRAGA